MRLSGDPLVGRVKRPDGAVTFVGKDKVGHLLVLELKSMTRAPTWR